MTVVDRFEARFVDAVPASIDAGVLYICLPYRTMSHLCACGCDRRIATPLRPAPHGWLFSFDGENVWVRPSVGLLKLPCKSHYVITRGRVHWLAPEVDDEVWRPDPIPPARGTGWRTSAERIRRLLRVRR